MNWWDSVMEDIQDSVSDTKGITPEQLREGLEEIIAECESVVAGLDYDEENT